jgi:hypothetical protein
MAMWALSQLIRLWAYPADTVDFVGIMEELQLLGSARLLSHLVVGHPQLFVDVVFIPITKSLTCYHPVQYLMKAVLYDTQRPEDSMRTIIDYLSPYVYASAGLVMNDILNMMSSKSEKNLKQREAIKQTANTAQTRTQPCDISYLDTSNSTDGITATGTGACTGADEDLCIEIVEYMFYYIQHHRKIALDQLISEHESANGADDVIKLSDDERADLDTRVIWFHPLESLTDKDPGVLYGILMSDRIQR